MLVHQNYFYRNTKFLTCTLKTASLDEIIRCSTKWFILTPREANLEFVNFVKSLVCFSHTIKCKIKSVVILTKRWKYMFCFTFDLLLVEVKVSEKISQRSRKVSMVSFNC